MNETDERYSTAEDAIYDAFFLLLREKELEKITVSDVIKKAGIVRSTFYNHYENIPALMEAAEDRTIQDIFTMMENFDAKDDRAVCFSYYLAICNYTKKNPFVANLLQSPRQDAFFEKAITMFHRYVTNVTQTNVFPARMKTRFSYMIAGAIGVTIGILHKWIAEEFRTPAEEIAEFLSSIFMSGILPYLSV